MFSLLHPVCNGVMLHETVCSSYPNYDLSLSNGMNFHQNNDKIIIKSKHYCTVF